MIEATEAKVLLSRVTAKYTHVAKYTFVFTTKCVQSTKNAFKENENKFLLFVEIRLKDYAVVTVLYFNCYYSLKLLD